MSERRQRADGTWTFSSPEWDETWYWPVGTRVELQDNLRERVRAGQYAGQQGIVVKENTVSVWVRLDDGETLLKVPVRALKRMQTAAHPS